MYDYLAKVILIGPSGSGKFVRTLCLRTIPGSYYQIMSSSPDSQGRVYASCKTYNVHQLTTSKGASSPPRR